MIWDVLVRVGPTWVLSCALLALSACVGSSVESESAAANIAGYNHTGDGIYRFNVNGYSSFSINAYGGGGSVCCAIYPRKWQPELTAKVKWATSGGLAWDNLPLTWHEATVAIERYEQTGTTMNVHFLPGGEVRILISDMSPRNEAYAGLQYPITPPGWLPKPPPEWIEEMEKKFGRARVIADE